MRRAWLPPLATLSMAVVAACSAPPAGPVASAPASEPRGTTRASASPVTLASAGDIHFAGVLASRLDDPVSAIGPMRSVLASADLAVANLETAVTTRGAPQDKQFVFRAPPTAFDAVRESGIDAVTMADNHGLDYGAVSVPDALGAAAAAGVATALDGQNESVVAAVRAVRPQVDTVVVELHYGSDLKTWPTTVQRTLADDLVAAGADVVVGQHAHVLLGGGYHGSAYVDYGLGNFDFSVSDGARTGETGVLTLTVDGRSASDPTWHPGRIVGGLPTALTGAAASEAVAHKTSLRGCAGLTADPTD